MLGLCIIFTGKNPISFPIRLYPNDKNTITRKKKNYPSKIFFNDNQIVSYKFSFMNLYFNKMLDDGFQLFHYNNFIKLLSKKNEIPISERKIGIQLSNIVYSLEDKKKNIKNIYGERGFNNFMELNGKKYSYVDQDEPIFDINSDYLKSISSKIYIILCLVLKKINQKELYLYIF